MGFPKSREEGSGEIRESAAKEQGFKLGDAQEKQRIGCPSGPAGAGYGGKYKKEE